MNSIRTSCDEHDERSRSSRWVYCFAPVRIAAWIPLEFRLDSLPASRLFHFEWVKALRFTLRSFDPFGKRVCIERKSSDSPFVWSPVYMVLVSNEEINLFSCLPRSAFSDSPCRWRVGQSGGTFSATLVCSPVALYCAERLFSLLWSLLPYRSIWHYIRRSTQSYSTLSYSFRSYRTVLSHTANPHSVFERSRL